MAYKKILHGPGFKQWLAILSSVSRMLITSSPCPSAPKKVREELEEVRKDLEAIINYIPNNWLTVYFGIL